MCARLTRDDQAASDFLAVNAPDDATTPQRGLVMSQDVNAFGERRALLKVNNPGTPQIQPRKLTFLVTS
jgi:hypothetical protein